MAKKKGLKSRLKAMQKVWKKGEAKTGGGKVPDDNYNVRIDSMTLEESKASSRLQVHYEMCILDGNYEGKKLHKYQGIEDQEQVDYFMGDLEMLEVEVPTNMEDIGESLEAAAGLLVELSVATRDEFQNIYLNELLEPEDGEEAGDDDEDEDEDDDADVDEDVDTDDDDEDDSDDDDDDDDEDEDEEEEDDDDEEDDETPAQAKKRLAAENKAKKTNAKKGKKK